MPKEYKIVGLFFVQMAAILYAATVRDYFAVGGEFLVIPGIYMTKFLIAQFKLVWRDAIDD